MCRPDEHLKYRVAHELGRFVWEVETRISYKELMGWAAYFKLQGELQNTASRHPEWPATKIWEYQKKAFNLHLKAKTIKGHNGNTGR